MSHCSQYIAWQPCSLAKSVLIAFFESGYEAAFGVVQRSWFEARLRLHFTNGKSDEDASWFALRNIIYALGCRYEMSANSTLLEISRASWPYFENALSVHIDLMFLPSTIFGVQALVLMVSLATN